MKNKAIFDKLASQEAEFFDKKTQFLSPVLAGKPVKIRIANIVMNLEVVKPKKFQGWGIFRPLSPKLAEFVRSPNLSEKRQYLDLFPTIHFILTSRRDDQWYGLPAYQADTRFKVTGQVPIRLPEEVQQFDLIRTRFDGFNCWFDCIDPRHNIKSARYLRDAIAQELDTNKLDSPGLLKEERIAYALAYLAEIEAKKDRNEERIKAALKIAGAEYRSYIERGDSFTIEYLVEGATHRSVVNKDTLEIQSSGICLSGRDRDFDLTSLVSVFREANRRGRIVGARNQGYYDDYEEDEDY